MLNYGFEEIWNLLNIVMSSFCHRHWCEVMTSLIVSFFEAELIIIYSLISNRTYHFVSHRVGDIKWMEERISTYFGLAFILNHKAHLSVFFFLFRSASISLCLSSWLVMSFCVILCLNVLFFPVWLSPEFRMFFLSLALT